MALPYNKDMRLLLSAVTVLLSAGFVTGQTRPAPRPTEMQKAIEEFKAQTRTLGLRADSPKAARGSGAKQTRYHGRLYHNLRNDILDAIPHEIRQRGTTKSLLRRNQWGFNIAGPLVIPKLYDGSKKTFVSVSYEGVRERISRSFLRTVPTLAERQGDYSAVVDQSGTPLKIFDPLTTRLNPDFDPSKPVTVDNLQYLRDPFPNDRIPANRLNPVAQQALTLYGDPNAAVGPFFRNNYFVVSPETNTANGMIFKVDHSLTPRHRVEVNGAFSNGLAGSARLLPTVADPNSPDREYTSRRAGVSYILTASPRTVSTSGFDVYSDTNRSTAEPFPVYSFDGSYLQMGRPSPSNRSAHTIYEFRNGWSLKRGNHNLRFGGEATFYQLNVLAVQYPLGVYRFSSGLTSLPGIVNTGHSFASFLLGSAGNGERSIVTAPSYFRRSRQLLYARDQYEIRRGLNVSGGLNFEINTPRSEKYNRQSTVDLKAVNPANGRPGALVAAGRNGYGSRFQPKRMRVEPSLSIAWNPGNDTRSVARLSFSRSYGGLGFGSWQWGTQGFNAYPTYISPNVQLQPALTLTGSLPPARVTLPDLRPDAANDTVADLVDPTSRQPRVQSVSASFERELPGAFVVTAGGYHTKGENMYAGNGASNPNAIPLDALEYRDRLNDESFRRTLRPYPQYQGFDVSGLSPVGQYARDAGYLRLEKRTSAGLGLSAYYEYSKQMDDYSFGIQDFYNRQNEWALSSYNNPQRLSLSYVYEVPLGSRTGILAFSDWRRYLVEGWLFSGMTTLYSGDPLILRPQFNNTGGVVSTLYVNTVPGVDASVSEQGPDLWFNPAAFEQPADFTTGNAPRVHPSLSNPGSQNHDLSVTKRFALDSDRAVELSAVGFNFINHANWMDPDNVIGPASAPNVNAGKIIGSRGGRIVQVGLRYSF